MKFELQDGYRLVFQQIDGEEALIALTAGTHDHVDSFLDGHRGYVFDRSGRPRELRIATLDETTVEIVPSDSLSRADHPIESPSERKALFAGFSPEMLLRIGVPIDAVTAVQEVTDADSIECMLVLQRVSEVHQEAGDLLLAFATGNSETRELVRALANGDGEYRPQLKASDVDDATRLTDQFLSFDDPSELQAVLNRGSFEQWQLFLHPDQQALVTKAFGGPARLRGISGSGKTVVALHRARHLARLLKPLGMKVLFTTFDKSLAAAAGRLLDSLCGHERDAIEVTHLHRWCLDYLKFCDYPRPRFDPEQTKEVRDIVYQTLDRDLQTTLELIPREYIWNEVEFLMGRFLHEDREFYLDTDRSGRGRPLSRVQREAVLQVYERYHRTLFNRGFVDPAEFVRLAYRLRSQGKRPEYQYGSVIADEVQDMSELGLKLLGALPEMSEDNLLLVGDNTQRIFTRGYSMRGLGIDISGRGIVLRKNYRNTRQILEAAFPMVSSDWEDDVRAAGLDPAVARPEFSVREGHRPIIVCCRSASAELEFVVSEVRSLLRYKHYSPKDICVMARNRHYRTAVFRALKEAGIPAYTFQPTGLGEATADDDGVRVSSLHGAKGHEFGAVFIVGAVEGVLPSRHVDEARASESAVLYVGITRARDIVYLSYSERDERNSPVTRSSLIDRIAAHCDFAEFRRPSTGIASRDSGEVPK